MKCQSVLRTSVAAAVAIGVAVVLGHSVDTRGQQNPSGSDGAPRIFTSPEAVAAHGTYTRVAGEALDEYRLRVAKAKRTYRDALTSAKQAAMKRANLDEANAIDTEIRNVDEDIQSAAAGDTPALGGPIVITRALYGAEGHWNDITKLLNSQIRQGRIQSVTGLADPAPGVPKMTIINGTWGGKEFTLQFPEQFPLNHLVFGVPPAGARN